jgi:hypothetical protein
MKDFDPIDQYLQKRIDQTEVSYSDQFWIDFQDKLPIATHPSFMSRLKEWLIKSKILHVVSIVLFLASAFYFTKNNNAEDGVIPDNEFSTEISEDGQSIDKKEENPKMKSGVNTSDISKTEQEIIQSNHIKDNKNSTLKEYDLTMESDKIIPVLKIDSLQENILINPTDSLQNEQKPKKKKHLIW